MMGEGLPNQPAYESESLALKELYWKDIDIERADSFCAGKEIQEVVVFS